MDTTIMVITMNTIRELKQRRTAVGSLDTDDL
jgi:hypothetical protein